MPVSALKITATGRDGISGRAAPGAVIEIQNLSVAPFGPRDQGDLVVRVRADSRGRFHSPVPAAREGDIVRVARKDLSGTGGNGQTEGVGWLNVRMHGIAKRDQRRVEADLQGMRLHRRDGGLELVSVRASERIAEPGATLRFKNQRSRHHTDVVLDADGCVPDATRIEGEAGDTFVVSVTDGVHDRALRRRWGSIIAVDPEADLLEPAVDLDSRRTAYVIREHRGPLVRDGIDADDPMQGFLGDCWLVAALSAIAGARPEVIERMIAPQPDGSFTITFKRFDHGKGRYVDHPVNVRSTFYRVPGAPLYGDSRGASSAGRMELWWPLVEKAYAKWKGGYDAIACGYPYAAFEAILGREGRHLEFEHLSDTETFDLLEQAVTEGSPIVVCTYPANERRSEKQGLVPDHAYTLLGTRRDGDACFVRLRNPWGALEPRGDAKDDGIFEIPLEKFTHYFCWASICPSA